MKSLRFNVGCFLSTRKIIITLFCISVWACMCLTLTAIKYNTSFLSALYIVYLKLFVVPALIIHIVLPSWSRFAHFFIRYISIEIINCNKKWYKTLGTFYSELSCSKLTLIFFRAGMHNDSFGITWNRDH